MKVVVLTFKSLCNWRLLFSPAEPHWEKKKINSKETSPAQLVQTGKPEEWQGRINFGCCCVLLMCRQRREAGCREMEVNRFKYFIHGMPCRDRTATGRHPE